MLILCLCWSSSPCLLHIIKFSTNYSLNICSNTVINFKLFVLLLFRFSFAFLVYGIFEVVRTYITSIHQRNVKTTLDLEILCTFWNKVMLIFPVYQNYLHKILSGLYFQQSMNFWLFEREWNYSIQESGNSMTCLDFVLVSFYSFWNIHELAVFCVQQCIETNNYFSTDLKFTKPINFSINYHVGVSFS